MNSHRPSQHMFCLADLLRDPEAVTIRIDGRSLMVRTGAAGIDVSEFFVPEGDDDEA